MRVLDLGGRWQVSRLGETEQLPAQVPGCVHTDLLASGKIEDPFYRDNEDRLQWIGEADWRYTRTFTVDAALLAHDRVLLRCDGLDTLATLTLNGVEIARTDNMYRTWEFDVRAALREGENSLDVVFASPIAEMKAREAQRSIMSWSGPKEPAGRAWIRKEPCNFGWDWGPVLVTCGIWRPITLVAFNTARLADMHVQQDHSRTGLVGLTVSATAEVATTAPLTATVTVTFEGDVVAETRVPLSASQATAHLTISDPQLWWPNGMGAQPRYEVTVTLLTGETTLDTLQKRIGLRTLVLDRHPDAWGESFQFVANGVPFFAKGANWIPADTFVTRLARADYSRLLADAAAANMNMLRVWGGGIYEQDMFYDLCDELGLCIWQDFMFACTAYPAFDAAFMRSVQAEAEDNVRRLRHHPCLALWCGNNELEQGLVNDSGANGNMNWEDYGKLFDTLLPEVVAALDPERAYWPCSPHSPLGDRMNFNNPTCGDAHLWDVWHGRKPFEWYRTCEHRFNSEFGFQSFPEPSTVYGYTAPQDRNVTTYVMEHHQRSGIGNTVIMQYLLDWYRLPTTFDALLWLSQIQQGMAIKYAVEHWRRAMPRGMGTLYWQLNDCWPVASWASIDSHGNWKALHHMAQRFYAPLLVSGVEDLQAGTVEIHVTNDLLTAHTGTVTWTLTDLDGTTLSSGSQPVTAPACANTLVTTVDMHEPLAAHGPREVLLWLDLVVDGKQVAENFISFARPKHLELRQPEIALSVAEGTGETFEVTLTATRPALWAWVELPGEAVRCSTNFIHLRPNRPVRLTLTPSHPMTRAEVEARLRVRSLVDTYSAAEVVPVA